MCPGLMAQVQNCVFHGRINRIAAVINVLFRLRGLADTFVPTKRFLFFSGTNRQTMPLTKNADI